uniref:Uncharacterized protein n=1 Tax=Erpetoichthys calabaricus TaxID=27687 RepID=A0A8C4RH98_ERPCA
MSGNLTNNQRKRETIYRIQDGPDHRLQFCEVVINEERQGNGIIDKVTLSDEAQYKLSGAGKCHNCVYYCTENPHVTIEDQLNQKGVTVWAGLSCKGVLEPVFFHTSVTHDLDLNMLRDNFLDQQLSNRWIDLTPMDFFFWGVIKDNKKMMTIKNCAKVCLSVASSLQECVNNECQKLEHL